MSEPNTGSYILITTLTLVGFGIGVVIGIQEHAARVAANSDLLLHPYPDTLANAWVVCGIIGLFIGFAVGCIADWFLKLR